MISELNPDVNDEETMELSREKSFSGRENSKGKKIGLT